ncbi:MAG: TRAP transporter small permease subunit, partial [Acidimicrobiales bacterium]
EDHSDAPGAPVYLPTWFIRIHPIGWVAVIYGLTALVLTILGSDYLFGNLTWQWLVVFVGIASSFSFTLLDRLRHGIEWISDLMGTIVWKLAWLVFFLQLFNVITRYSNDYVEQDILFGEVTSLAWMTFGMIILLGAGYGTKVGVNPRIDFWWAEFSHQKKAWIDFVLHSFLLLPFIVMGMRLLTNFAASSLGRKFSGEWPSGFRVWESWEQSGDASQLPVGPIQAFIFVGFALWGIQVLAEVIKTGFIILGREDLGQIAEAEAPLRVE